MGRVDCIALPGLILLFYSSDHAPAHFHVRRPGHWEIRVFIETTTKHRLDWSPRWPPHPSIPSGVLRRLARATAAHRMTLLEEWELKVARR